MNVVDRLGQGGKNTLNEINKIKHFNYALESNSYYHYYFDGVIVEISNNTAKTGVWLYKDGTKTKIPEFSDICNLNFMIEYEEGILFCYGLSSSSSTEYPPIFYHRGSGTFTRLGIKTMVDISRPEGWPMIAYFSRGNKFIFLRNYNVLCDRVFDEHGLFDYQKMIRSELNDDSFSYSGRYYALNAGKIITKIYKSSDYDKLVVFDVETESIEKIEQFAYNSAPNIGVGFDTTDSGIIVGGYISNNSSSGLYFYNRAEQTFTALCYSDSIYICNNSSAHSQSSAYKAVYCHPGYIFRAYSNSSSDSYTYLVNMETGQITRIDYGYGNDLAGELFRTPDGVMFGIRVSNSSYNEFRMYYYDSPTHTYKLLDTAYSVTIGRAFQEFDGGVFFNGGVKYASSTYSAAGVCRFDYATKAVTRYLNGQYDAHAFHPHGDCCLVACSGLNGSSAYFTRFAIYSAQTHQIKMASPDEQFVLVGFFTAIAGKSGFLVGNDTQQYLGSSSSMPNMYAPRMIKYDGTLVQLAPDTIKSDWAPLYEYNGYCLFGSGYSVRNTNYVSSRFIVRCDMNDQSTAQILGNVSPCYCRRICAHGSVVFITYQEKASDGLRSAMLAYDMKSGVDLTRAAGVTTHTGYQWGNSTSYCIDDWILLKETEATIWFYSESHSTGGVYRILSYNKATRAFQKYDTGHAINSVYYGITGTDFGIPVGGSKDLYVMFSRRCGSPIQASGPLMLCDLSTGEIANIGTTYGNGVGYIKGQYTVFANTNSIYIIWPDKTVKKLTGVNFGDNVISIYWLGGDVFAISSSSNAYMVNARAETVYPLPMALLALSSDFGGYYKAPDETTAYVTSKG